MKFGNFDSIHFIWFFIALVLFFVWAHKKKKKVMEGFADKELLNELLPSLDRKKQRLKPMLMLAGILFLVVALMRPQWGFEWKEVSRSGLDILIAIDTSRSMLAQDVKPNRLERSKLAVKDLVKKLRGDRIGLIAFAGNAFLQCPLTVDYNGFMLSLDALDTDTIPRGGTSLESAVKTAFESFEGGAKKYKVLVIITDGEDHEGSPVELAAQAKEKGIKIYTIGIGTKEGELVPVVDKEGNMTFLKDRNNNVIKTRLDDTALKKIALDSGGSYVKAASMRFGLNAIYDEKLSKLEKREIKNKMVKKYKERFQIPLLVALLLFCIEPFIRERKKYL